MSEIARQHDSNHRDLLYHDLHHRQLDNQRDANHHSALAILSSVFRVYRPSSVLDVGCGLGTWLAVASRLGVGKIRGVDGPWLDESLLEVSPECVAKVDLEADFDLGDRFDLVISLEVGEHLSESASASFVASLTRHAPVVLFSAAIPFQGGHHHVNERWPSYWAARFRQHDHVVIDAIRARFWSDDSILWWLRQNIIMFAHRDTLASHTGLRRLHEQTRGRMPLDVVHPAVYLTRMRAANELAAQQRQLADMLSSGGTLHAQRDESGRLCIRKQ